MYLVFFKNTEGRVLAYILKEERCNKKIKTNFFFLDFLWFFWTKMGVKLMIFHTFFENVDSAKISVSPRREHDFRGSEPPKMRPKSL